jgi:WD40 repeat protein
MNKDLLNILPADERPIASTLNSTAENMQVSPAFQWDLETQLLEKHKTNSQPIQSWHTKIIPSLGWTILALSMVFLLNWIVRSVAPDQPAVGRVVSEPKISFEDNVRQGNICTGPLALAHNFSVYLTNHDKTGFEMLDEHRTIGELRSFSWSPDYRQLAVLGNNAGNGNIYLTNVGQPLQAVLSNSEVGYLTGASWSHDGKQLLMWSSQNNSIIYVVNADGAELIERHLSLQILGTPQFTPDGESIIFYGADSTSTGLFEATLDGSQKKKINPLLEDETGFAISPNGLHLAYIAMDRSSGVAVLMVHDLETGAIISLPGSLPIPKGSGSSIPESANLSWAPDGKSLVFEFGRSVSDRAIYLAYADGTGISKLADSAHAPAISADGKCLAYISDKQVFLLDLTDISLTSMAGTPLLLAELPARRSNSDFRLDKLQWAPRQP